MTCMSMPATDLVATGSHVWMAFSTCTGGYTCTSTAGSIIKPLINQVVNQPNVPVVTQANSFTGAVVSPSPSSSTGNVLVARTVASSANTQPTIVGGVKNLVDTALLDTMHFSCMVSSPCVCAFKMSSL